MGRGPKCVPLQPQWRLDGRAGAVSWQFERKGIVSVPLSFDEEKVMEVAMEGGAENLSNNGEHWILLAPPPTSKRVPPRSKRRA